MDGLRPAISSMSLGRAWIHSMPSKLSAASNHNILGLEVFYGDLEYLARTESNTETPSPEALLHAASTIKTLCDERNITIIGLQPFSFYEGLKDRNEHAEKIEKMKLWFKIVKILGTDLIQIPANFLPREKLTDDMDIIISDLQEVADMGAKEEPLVRFAYENLCWSTFFDTWEAGWDIVTRVDRENFGFVLDTFNIAARVYGDPASVDGKTENAGKALNEIVEAEKMQEPLVKGHAFWDDKQPARRVGVDMPVTRIIVECLGYQGWVSMELFNRSMAEEGESVLDEYAKRAEDFWKLWAEYTGPLR
ncbi:hypothetical protein EAF00_005166 [Botryotinia globosa]|nr:hypothetical protein EAF00_005166 [Botryotinia globosa]